MAWLELDKSLFLWINGLSGHSQIIDNVISAIANDYFSIVFGCMIMMALWTGTPDPDKRRHIQKGIMVASASLGTCQGMVEIINNLWQRARPFHDLDVNLLFYPPTDPSFPSNSATVLFGMAWGIFIYNRKAGSVLLVLAGLMGFSRVYVGVHYPLDIIGGMAVGLLVALFFTIVFRLLDPLINRVIDTMRFFFLA
ncbi:MAG: phosphatase PAP2 family protein [Dehalococcoidales bacterium]|nr:phosphatase PAP2 family protein [Dehalococcoidales bacterium]MDD3264625.1 phosphatase PAP2 family protein [Dehalococcoidales bacterium]MDD4322299.1 phosphatase PAP2 family protein [Dehalococcoidales bacterium]MDD4794141.1 phosphatase PAP2 family protein [Dehalococcoidales bacterium]MDD5122419.1 phosphatase PAP2 family protein [Dehalococcoidales bacterium]